MTAGERAVYCVRPKEKQKKEKNRVVVPEILRTKHGVALAKIEN